MGIVQKIDVKRDRSLIRDYKKRKRDGVWRFSIKELGEIYARVEGEKTIPLSRQRIHQILDRYGIEKTRTFPVVK